MHTPEPWFQFGAPDRPGPPCIGGPFEPGPGDDPAQKTAGIAHFGMRLRTNEEAQANARRAVVCVNFCAGTDSEFLEGANLGRMIADGPKHRRQRDLLLTACESILDALRDPLPLDPAGLVRLIEAAVAEAKRAV